MNSQVHQHSELGDKKIGIGAQSQLEKLKTDLLTKREASVKEGHVQDIQMIDKALDQVGHALEQEILRSKSISSQARLGNIKPATQNISHVEEAPRTISDAEAQQIKAIRAVAGSTIAPGQQFASMHGREPSNISYMKNNIKGLFDLVSLKG